jgi:hypothetical protein
MTEWVVDVKGHAGAESFEISVLRGDNEFGKRSYGYFGESKLLITHNGGPCRWPLTPRVWSKAVALAREVADELNSAERVTRAGK